MSLLTVEGLSFAYRHGKHQAEWTLKNISFAVEAGEYIALTGPNGSGKSTLFQLLCASLRPGQGRALLDGRDITAYEARERAARLAMIPQGARINFPYTALELTLMGLYPHRSRFEPLSAAHLERTREIMTEAGVWRFASKPVTELSGGQLQSVLLARALLQIFPTPDPSRPALLLLDEAMSGLDIAARLAMTRLLRRYAATGKAAIIGIQHDLHTAGRFASRVIALSEGRLAADGPPEKVFTEEFFRNVFAVRAEIIPGKGFVFEE